MGINQKLLKSILLSSLILWTIPTFATIYEDAEDNATTGWRISGDATDATIKNVFDIERGSRVIKLTGNKKETGYRIGNRAGRASYVGAWHNKTETQLKWSMKYTESFRIYIPITTEHGNRYLTYTNQSVDAKGKIRGGKVNYGLGEDSIDGTWHTFTRDLEADWNAFMPNDPFVAVNGFFIKGSGYIDDIMSSSGVNPPIDTTKPIIRLLRDAIVTLTVGDTYTDAGATATDDVDGNITSSIQVIGLPIDTSSEGNYTVTYSVSDLAGNQATKTRKVNVVAVGKLRGQVVDLSGNPISGAVVRVETKDKVTDSNGSFYFDDLAVSERSVLLASHQDYLTNSRIIRINSSVETRMTIVLSKANSSQSFASSDGVTVSQSDGASIVLPPDIYVDREGNRYDGDVNLSLSYYPITTQNGQALFPGNFDAINQDNERGTLQSYGFVLISLEDSSGNPLDINGRATISLPADSSLGTPLPTIPLWYYDENRGIWVEDGEATYNISTGRYEGEITRIATYNLDVFVNPTNLKVCVEDTNGTKVSNAYVQLKNQTLIWYANVGPTGQDGYINILGVLGGTDLNVSAYTFDGRYGEYSSNPINLNFGQDNELDSCIVINDKNSSTGDVNLTKGLVAHYEFEGNANDSSGNGNDGTEHGGVSYVDGMIGQAGRFDGVDDWILIKNNDSLNITKAITMSAWVYIENYYNGWASILTKGDTSSMNSPYALLVYQRKLEIALNRHHLHLEENNVLDKKWTNIVITWDGLIVRYFVDGIEQSGTRNFNNSLNVIDGNLVIGKDAPGATEWFTGKIDDLRLYNRALNEAEIKELYKLGKIGNAIYYKDFAITKKRYEETSNLDEIVQNTFGSEYRIADWEDLEKFYYDKNGDLLDLFDNLNLKEHGSGGYVTWHGNRIWNGRRHYYVSRHEHNKPSYYLDHANIDNNLISLGSWYNMKTNILVIKKSF